MRERRRVAEAMHARQSRQLAGRLLAQFEGGAEVGRVAQFRVFLAGAGRVAIAPEAHVRRERAELGARRPIEAKARRKDQEVEAKHALGRRHVQGTVVLVHAQHGAAEVEARVRVPRHAQRAAARRRHLLGIDVMADAPFPGVRQMLVAMDQPRAARALALVDAGQVGAADQQIDARGAGFQRGGGRIHGRRARADHAHPFARQRAVVHRIGRMRPPAARQAVRERRHGRAAQAVTAGGQHHAARQHALPGCVRCVEGQLDRTVGARLHGPDVMCVADLQLQHAAVPAQVVHPLQARDLVERLPGIGAELRLEPGTEGQRGQAQCGAGQLLGRAQRFHAGGGRPRAFVALGRAVEHHRADAEMLERRRRDHARHASADDGDVQHGLPVQRVRQCPGFGGQFEPGEILAQAGFQRRQSGGLRRVAVCLRAAVMRTRLRFR